MVDYACDYRCYLLTGTIILALHCVRVLTNTGMLYQEDRTDNNGSGVQGREIKNWEELIGMFWPHSVDCRAYELIGFI